MLIKLLNESKIWYLTGFDGKLFKLLYLLIWDYSIFGRMLWLFYNYVVVNQQICLSVVEFFIFCIRFVNEETKNKNQ